MRPAFSLEMIGLPYIEGRYILPVCSDGVCTAYENCTHTIMLFEKGRLDTGRPGWYPDIGKKLRRGYNGRMEK